MGHQTLVYGVIEVPTWSRQGEQDPQEANRLVLDELPIHDEWPFIVRSMFAQSRSTHVSIEYAASLIHFAASYKEVEDDWAAWVSKFERLLSRLRGSVAVVHIDSERLPHRRLTWSTISVESGSVHINGAWKFLDGPRTTAELYGEEPTQQEQQVDE